VGSDANTPDRRGSLLLIGLLIVALGLRLGWALSRPVDEAALAALPDQMEYLELGRNMLAGDGLFMVDARFGQRVYAFRAPGYPALVAACGGKVAVVRVVQALIDTSTALAAYLLSKRWVPRRFGQVASALVALNPFMIYFSGLILSETLFTALLAWGMVLLTRQGARLTWASGCLVLALSVLVRPGAIGLPVLLAVSSTASSWWAAPGAARRWPLPPASTALLLTLLVLAPWAYRNRQAVGEWVWTTTNGGFTAYDGLSPEADGASDQRFVRYMPQLQAMSEVERSRYLGALARQYARQNPRRAIELAAAKLRRTWSPMPLSEEFGRPLHVLAALAYAVPLDVLAVIGLWRGLLPWSAKVLLAAPAIYLSVVHMASVGSLRYRIPAEVAMAVLAAGAVAWMSSRHLRRA
jgi:4-amino-4-deoxy-L-arabinose transferase-like glycosyltransferase